MWSFLSMASSVIFLMSIIIEFMQKIPTVLLYKIPNAVNYYTIAAI